MIMFLTVDICDSNKHDCQGIFERHSIVFSFVCTYNVDFDSNNTVFIDSFANKITALVGSLPL